MSSLPHAPFVEFLNVLDQYSLDKDLTCNFKFSSKKCESFVNHFVAIFKLGWTNVTDYIAIKGIPNNTDMEQYSVTFDKNILPRNTMDLYQICYINESDVYGASTPFQFCSGDDTNCPDSLHTYLNITEKDEEIQRLKEENSILRESLKALLSKKSQKLSKNYEKDIEEVKDLVSELKNTLLIHEKDIKMLKDKIREGGEEYRKLYLEKHTLQKKYHSLKRTYIAEKHIHLDGQQPINAFYLDLGDLSSLPPFPSVNIQ